MNAALVDTRRIRRQFSCHAEEYDRYAGVQKRVTARLLSLIPAGDPISGPALDVGTGTGALARGIAQARPGVPLVISDLAHGMTLNARASVPAAPALDADAQALPFRNGCFSLVASASVYQWVNDLPGAFTEAARVLCPGGLFAVALFGRRTLFELRGSHRLAVAESDGLHPSHAQDFPALAEVGAALSRAGLRQVGLQADDEVEYHPDVAALLRSLKRIGAQNASCERPQGLASRRVMQRMMEIYGEKYGRTGEIPATYEVIYALGRKTVSGEE